MKIALNEQNEAACSKPSMLELGVRMPNSDKRYIKNFCSARAREMLGQLLEDYDKADPSPNLYGGQLGALVALCQIGSSLGDNAYSKVASKIAQPPRYSKYANIGAFSDLGLARGAGALIYAQAIIGQASGLERHLNFARFLAENWLLRATRVSKEIDKVDILHGLAGLLIASCRVAELYASSNLLAAIEGSSECLASLVHDADASALSALGASASHGLSGLGYALYLSGQLANSQSSIDAGQKCLTIEGAMYDVELIDWPDRRYAVPRANGAWCHGSAGIGMFRLALRRQFADVIGDRFDRTIAQALSSILTLPLSPLQSACCGNFGRLAFLAYAAQLFGDRSLHELSLSLATWLTRHNDTQSRIPHSLYTGKSTLFQGGFGILAIACGIAFEKPFPTFLAFEIK